MWIVWFVLIIGGFILYDKTYKVNKSLDNIDLKKAKNLMIVAHPDDETLWGGGHLSEGNYLIVCITAGSNRFRVSEFRKAVEKCGNQYIMLGYPDLTWTGVAKWHKEWIAITEDIKKIILAKPWDMIVTHNNHGEYGHIHHRYTSKIVTGIIKSLKVPVTLYHFGTYYQKGQETGKQISKEMLDQKIVMMSYYRSQFPVRIIHKHMYSYENWQKIQ